MQKVVTAQPTRKGRMKMLAKKSNSDYRKSQNMKFFLRVVANTEIYRPEEEKEAVRSHLRKNGYRALID